MPEGTSYTISYSSNEGNIESFNFDDKDAWPRCHWLMEFLGREVALLRWLLIYIHNKNAGMVTSAVFSCGMMIACIENLRQIINELLKNLSILELTY